MRHHAALTAAALILRAEHEELCVALRAPRRPPRCVRIGLRALEAVLRQMMFFGLQRRQPPRQIGAPALDVVDLERARFGGAGGPGALFLKRRCNTGLRRNPTRPSGR